MELLGRPCSAWEGGAPAASGSGASLGTAASAGASSAASAHGLGVPKESDRTQVEAREVRFSDMPAVTLDDTNVNTDYLKKGLTIRLDVPFGCSCKKSCCGGYSVTGPPASTIWCSICKGLCKTYIIFF